jgi:hypothetical protein
MRTRRKILQRFKYAPRMTAAELRAAMDEIDLTVDELTLVSGARRSRVLDWLHGSEDIPVYVQRDFALWLEHDDALEAALDWAEAHAKNVYEDPV